MEYKPYKGLNSLQNNEPRASTGFNWQGYSDFMADRFTIVDKKKQEVSFTQQPAQDDFLYWMSVYLNILILKARKMGFSSTALGVGTTKFINGKNEKCVSMSFDADASVKQLARAKHYIKSYERKKSQELQQEFKLPLKYNSKKELVLECKDEETGEEWINTLRVGTAKSTSFGRGDDITFLHLTEVAFCDDVEVLLAGVGEALVEGAHTIFETTANGFNSYKSFWDAAILNKKGFAALFYSPMWEYDQAYLENREKKLGRLFTQEYPMTPQDAFLTSGLPFFDTYAMRDYLKQVQKAMAV